VSGETQRGHPVFVTGAYGLLGSWLVKALLERGARTTVLRRDAVALSALSLAGTKSHVNSVLWGRRSQ
jgi:CDP-glucose 4,6-dehydratase